MCRKMLPLGLAAAIVAALTVTASAQSPQKHHRPPVAQRYPDERPPLTVTRRSWLDPGTVAPVGKQMPNYMAASTTFNLTPDQVFATSAFGNDRLPQPLQVPGRPSPIYQFETPASPF